ncbi:MAG: GNAT family N-acetyltransferase [Balneolaceae bacterium]
MQATPKTNGVTIVTTKEERAQFLDFPYHHYRDDQNWVAPLRIEQKKLIDTGRNPFFNDAEIALFLAEEDGRPAGRIAAILDHRYNRFHDSHTGFFGFFESVDSQGTVDLLMRVASDWLKDRGVTRLLGPANPGMMDEIGILVDGFDRRPSILMPYHKPWYDKLLKGAGLEKEIDLFAFEVTENSVQRERMNRAADIVHKRVPGLNVREIRMKSLRKELDIIRHIFNEAWKENWGFIPLTSEELETMASDMKKIVDTRFAHVAEIDGEPVAFSIALPDYNQVFARMNGKLLPLGIFKLLWYRRKINRIRTALMGVLPEYRGRGIDAVLHQKSIENGLRDGFTSSELSWVLENNTEMIRVAEKIGGERSKTYRMYSKAL